MRSAVPYTSTEAVGIAVIAASAVLALVMAVLLLLASQAHPPASEVLDALTSPAGVNAPTT